MTKAEIEARFPIGARIRVIGLPVTHQKHISIGSTGIVHMYSPPYSDGLTFVRCMMDDFSATWVSFVPSNIELIPTGPVIYDVVYQ